MDNVNAIVQQAVNSNQACALYRLPNAAQANACWGDLTAINTAVAGFVFAPFSGEPLFLPHVEQQQFSFDVPLTNLPPVLKAPIDSNSSQLAFEQLVEKAIQAMKRGEADKIVGSRVEAWETKYTNPVAWFCALAHAYPQAMVYLWYAPQSGYWIGATPERLFSLDAGELHTMALAGTQINQGKSPVVWGEKEQEEQAFVTRYIAEELQKLTPEVLIGTPHTVEAAQLLHIRTLLQAKLNPLTSWLDAAKLLHPTPAVCGTPKANAFRFLLENEGYDRAYYAGYLGPVAANNQADIYVNLRCMRVLDEQVQFYVGCGLTVDSNATLEWEETANKSQTLKKVLQ